MSVTIPSAERDDTAPVPRPSRLRRRWAVSIGLGVAIGVLAVGEAEDPPPASFPVVEPIAPDVTTPTASAASPSSLPLADAAPVLFPGDGSFVATAWTIHGAVAIGERAVTPGAFVWTAVPGLGEWTRRQVEAGDRASLSDVTGYMDGFLAGGAVVTPGTGSAVPTLWFGSATSDLAVVGQPYSGPGRVGGVKVIRGNVFVIGQSPFGDPFARGAARAGRLLVGRPGSWEDITPPGANLVFSDVTGSGDGIVVAGGDVAGAKLWWQPSPGAEWVTIDLGDGVVTDLLVRPGPTLVASVRTWDSDGTVRSQLHEGVSPRAMVPLGPTLRRDLEWIRVSGDAVIGGARRGATSRPTVWALGGDDSWEPVYLPGDTGTVRGSGDTVLLGTVQGQPAMWGPDRVASTLLVERVGRAWEPVVRLPAGADSVTDVDGELVAIGPDRSVVWVWAERGWDQVDVGEDFVPTGFVGDGDSVVIFGNRPGIGVIRRHPTAEGHDLEGVTIRHVVPRGEALVVLGESSSGPVRIDVVDGIPGTPSPLARLPVRIFGHDGLLIGMGHERPIREWAVSVDLGRTWVDMDQPAFTIGVAGGRLVIVTADTPRRVLALAPSTLEFVEVVVGSTSFFDTAASPGATLMGWADGVAATGASFVRIWPDLTGEAVQLPTGVEHGLDGAFMSLVPGAGGYALASHHGQPMVYRWLGS